MSIDQHMKWKSHIAFLVIKLRSMLYKFKILKELLPVHILRTLYHALVESHLRYGILSWGSAFKSHLFPLEVLQRRFLRLIYSKKALYHTDDLYSETQVMDLRQLYFYNSNIRYHINKQAAQLPSHNYNTRHQHLFIIPLMLKTLTQHTFLFLAPRLYNSLPQQLKNITNPNKYKKLLKRHIFEIHRQIIIDLFEK